MIQIRPYQNSDKEQIEEICAADKAPMREALLACFCHYYLECEPENCFVCKDTAGKVSGYVLCAADFTKWEEVMRSKYIKNDPVCLAIGNATIENLRAFSGDYPAHLHIDLVPDAQGQGLGSRLISALKDHLRALGIHGLMLDVSENNKGAQSFYQKNGFTFLDKDENSCRMGIKL